MDALTWTIIGVAFTGLLGFGGVLVRLMDRLNKSEALAATAKERADSATLSIAANGIEIDQLQAELTRHQIDTAREYVSKPTLESLENRIVNAIEKLGDRIDKLVIVTRTQGDASHA